MINLMACKPQNKYKIVKIETLEKSVLIQLENIMIKLGSEVEVKKQNYGKKSILVSVHGISYAIDSLIAKKIYVSEAACV